MYTAEREFLPLPDEKRVVVEQLLSLEEALRAAIARLDELGIASREGSRLKECADILNSTATAGAYPAGEDALAEVGEAVLTARDFRDVSNALPKDVSDRLTRGLGTASGGPIEDPTAGGAPRQFQTQLWFGAVMTAGGLNPRVRFGDDGPDFLVRPGALSYGVEVKHPTSERGAFECLRNARHQLATVGHGVVVMELSDCLDNIGLQRFGPKSPGPTDREIKRKLRELADRLSGLVWDWNTQTHRPTFKPVFALWVFARGWRWDVADRLAPELLGFQRMHRYCSTAGNVWCHKADEFMKQVSAGLEAGGFPIHLADQESPTPIARPFFDDLPD